MNDEIKEYIKKIFSPTKTTKYLIVPDNKKGKELLKHINKLAKDYDN